jgi:hypothetical protein
MGTGTQGEQKGTVVGLHKGISVPLELLLYGVGGFAA